MVKRQNKQSKQLYCPPCCLRWEPVRHWDYLTVVHTFLGLTNCWWNGHVKDKHKVQKEMCRDIQQDHCRMRERGMGADSVGLEHRPSSPPQAFDLATCPTSAESAISVEKAARFSSRTYALRDPPPPPPYRPSRHSPGGARLLALHMRSAALPHFPPPLSGVPALLRRRHADAYRQP